MPEKTWRQTSMKYIEQGYFEVKKEKSELSDEEILKIVSRDCYPFGERANFPYKAGLSAIKAFRNALGVKTKQYKKNNIQTPLFGNE